MGRHDSQKMLKVPSVLWNHCGAIVHSGMRTPDSKDNRVSHPPSSSCWRWFLVLMVTLTMMMGCVVPRPIDLLNAMVPSSGYTFQGGVEYGKDERQKLDIYFPMFPASHTRVIVFVYGGAWREGGRAEYEFVGQALAEAGHTVVIPDYRLYPSVVYPQFLADIVLAINAVRAPIEKMSNIGLEEVVLMGHSSGAHTAAMLASDRRWLEASRIDPIALIAIAGPYALPLDDSEVTPVFPNVTEPDEVRPVALVDYAHPPTLLLHGDEDKRVLPSHTREYALALASAGIRVDVSWLEGVGHAEAIAGIAAPLDFSNQNRRRITTFLDSL